MRSQLIGIGLIITFLAGVSVSEDMHTSMKSPALASNDEVVQGRAILFEHPLGMKGVEFANLSASETCRILKEFRVDAHIVHEPGKMVDLGVIVIETKYGHEVILLHWSKGKGPLVFSFEGKCYQESAGHWKKRFSGDITSDGSFCVYDNIAKVVDEAKSNTNSK